MCCLITSISRNLCVIELKWHFFLKLLQTTFAVNWRYRHKVNRIVVCHCEPTRPSPDVMFCRAPTAASTAAELPSLFCRTCL